MSNVRLARAWGVLALMTGGSSVALAQDPLAPDPVAEGEAQAQLASGELTAGQADAARAEMAETFGIDELAPGEFRWASDIPSSGPTRIVVSLSDQLAFVYRGDALIGVSTVSSGMTDHETPTGVFPILAKEKVHRSRTYDDAPMPYMQRLNQYGVALHGGHVPGYPASHGCVRLPMKFAARLFELTARGSAVIIEA